MKRGIFNSLFSKTVPQKCLLSDCSQLDFLSTLLSLFFHAEYLEQVDLEEKKEGQETKAMQEFDSGDTKAKTVPQLLQKLSRPGQMPFYYCGGFEILSQAVTECECSCGGQAFFALSFFPSYNLFVLLVPLGWFTYFTAPWLNGPSAAKVK